MDAFGSGKQSGMFGKWIDEFLMCTEVKDIYIYIYIYRFQLAIYTMIKHRHQPSYKSRSFAWLQTLTCSLSHASQPSPRKGLVQLRTTSCVHAKILLWPIRFVDHLIIWHKREYARTGEVEDVRHLLMRCTYVEEERGKLKELMYERVEGFRMCIIMTRWW